NGNNHYALILGKLGNNYIIQDPFLGTVIMSQEQFNKYYTGNVLTMNFEGLGTLLSIDEMKGLFGGVVDSSVSSGLGAFNWEPDSQKIKDWYNNLPPEKREELKKNLNYGTNSAVESWMSNVQPDPLAAAILITLCIGGFIILTGGAGAAVIVPLIPFMGESAAAGTVTVETAAAAAATGTATGIGITATLINALPRPLQPVARLILERIPQWGINLLDWGFKGFSVYSMDVLGIGQSVFEILGPRISGSLGYGISSLIRNPFYQLTSLQLNTLQLADYYNKTNQDNIISRINNYAKQGYNAAVNWTNTTYNNYIKPLADKFKQERTEYQKKGVVKYLGDKYTQTKTFVKETAPKIVKYYNKTVKPWMEKNVKPAMHKRLDPVWSHPATQWLVKNVPGAKHVTDRLGWF
ncbi:MAG: hypothetical protein HZC47_00005, partial [Methanobacterium sp.]|uniref:cysteine peptidase family C39 domain-containing protein n=1 Tax=Methanobacterium sp. TaxID=2164 RepID=UPI003D64C54E|nr:hypothetical protein [Methanobacterium sp.]